MDVFGDRRRCSGASELSRRPAGLAGQPSTGHERASRAPGETRCGRVPAPSSRPPRRSPMGAAPGSTFRDAPQFSYGHMPEGASVIRSTVRSVAMSAVLVSGAAWLEPPSAQVSLGEVVVTPGGGPEPRKRFTGTVQVIGRDLVAADSPAVAPAPAGRAGANVVGPVQIIENSEIERSTAKSVTELLAQNAVGFMSEWTPGQTSINIRGAATDGQGRDFKSQVLVLINGHRAGTANLSKMSLADIDRIEIVRGPASVVYGSQNMGGVINIITKTGRTAPGGFIDGNAGSWGTKQGKAQYGGMTGMFDYYLGVSGGVRDDFKIGGGK